MRVKWWLIGPIGAVLVVLTSTGPAMAYIGPEVGSAAVQSLIATSAVLAGIVSQPFLRLKRLLSRLVSYSKSDANQSDGTEPRS